MSKFTDIMSLVKAGYTKKEIAEILKEDNSETTEKKETKLETKVDTTKGNITSDEMNTLIESLKSEVTELRKTVQENNRSKLSGEDDNKTQTTKDILSSIINPNEDAE